MKNTETLLINPDSLKFFQEWNEIHSELEKSIKNFRISQKALSEIGISLTEVLNFYTERLAAFIVYEAYIDSDKKIDYEFILACELLDIVLFHLLDDIIDKSYNPYVEKYGEQKILALSLPILFETIKKYPVFKELVKFYEYDYQKSSILEDYLRKLAFDSYYPIKVIFNYIKPNNKVRRFWRVTSQYLKILDDIKDNDVPIDKYILVEIAKKYANEILIYANTLLQKKFVNYIFSKNVYSIIEEKFSIVQL